MRRIKKKSQEKYNFFTEKALIYLPISIFALYEFIFIAVPILRGIFFFTFDQARDAIWVKNQIDFRQPSLIGPWGSLTGTFFGPLWFWLLAIPYIFFGGNPTAMTFFNIFIVYAASFLASIVIKKHSPLTAYFILLLGLLSPGIHNIATYAFSQHLLPILTFILIFCYAQILTTSNPFYFYLGLFSTSLMFHAEPPLFLFSLPTFFIIVYLSPDRKIILNLKVCILGIVFFLIPFVPLLIFETRHKFMQFQSVISYLGGTNRSLGDILPFLLRLKDRPLKFLSTYKMAILETPMILTIPLFFLTIYTNIRHLKNGFIGNLWKGSVIYVLSLFIIFIIYPPELKYFYLDGILMIFNLWVAIAFCNIWESGKIHKMFIVSYIIFAFFINKNPFVFINSLKNNFADKLRQGSIYANQTAIVDWIYQNASGHGFKVYTYDPAVYDYPFQYLFLWYGLKNMDIYQKNFPIYQINQNMYKKRQNNSLVYVIKLNPQIIFST